MLLIAALMILLLSSFMTIIDASFYYASRGSMILLHQHQRSRSSTKNMDTMILNARYSSNHFSSCTSSCFNFLNEDECSSIARRSACATIAADLLLRVCCAPLQVNAACLSGDTSEDCIGVYKVPIDEEILPYVGTKENLLRFAPDVKWVPPVKSPESLTEAKAILKEDYDKLRGQLEILIMNGDLVSAGKLVLEVMPRVTVAGQLVADDVFEKEKTDATSVKYLRVEVAFEELVIALGQFDVALGQGLRGQYGGITVTQLALLPDAKELIRKFSDFVSVSIE